MPAQAAQLDTKLYSALLELGAIDEKVLNEVKQEVDKTGQSLERVLLEKDLISDENLGKVLADITQLPLIRLGQQTIPPQTLTIIPESFAHDYSVIVFKTDDSKVHIATSDPGVGIEDKAIVNIAFKTKLEPQIYYATRKDIIESLNLYKDKTKDILTESTTEMLKNLIQGAYDSKASDIHIEPREKDVAIRFRIDGILHDIVFLSKKAYELLLTKVKVDAKLRTDDKFSAQDGRMFEETKSESLDIRVSIIPVVHGESVVLRILSSRMRQYGLNDLGLSEGDKAKIKKAYMRPYGMIISTGPTGSGKTTSIYSIIKVLNTRERKIETIEDPVEYSIEGVTQIQVNNKTNLTFAEGLRSILRQDPDTIFIGEIRDKETTNIAVNAALTGHLVLSTLHTNDAATAIPRLLDMGAEPFLVASSVNLIIAQRLVRQICDKCKVSSEADLKELSKYFDEKTLKTYFGAKKKVNLYKGKGCPVCKGTGYKGRIGIFEVLEISDAIRTLINKKASADQIFKQAVNDGMTPMVSDGIEKVKLGLTTLEELLRVTKL